MSTLYEPKPPKPYKAIEAGTMSNRTRAHVVVVEILNEIARNDVRKWALKLIDEFMVARADLLYSKMSGRAIQRHSNFMLEHFIRRVDEFEAGHPELNPKLFTHLRCSLTADKNWVCRAMERRAQQEVEEYRKRPQNTKP